MIDDLPTPEPGPINTKVITEFITLEFGDDGKTTVTFGIVKGYVDSSGAIQRDERTRLKTSCDSLDITQNMGPKDIIKAVKAELKARSLIG